MSRQLPRRGRLALGLAALWLLHGALSIWLGPDLHWDLRNYHHYNAYALLHDRADVDVAPAMLQTWHNPYADVPAYVLMRYVAPSVALVALALPAAVEIWLTILLASACGLFAHRWRNVLVVATTMAACGGAIHWSLIGRTTGDSLANCFVLAGLLFVLTSDGRSRRIVLGGVAAGFGAGIKLTAGLFLPGLLVVAAFLSPSLVEGLRRVLRCGLGALAGLLLLQAPWSVHLWQELGNPLFPYFNSVFESPYWSSEFTKPSRAPGPDWSALWSSPLRALRDSPPVRFDAPLRDFRLPTALLCGLLALAWPRRVGSTPPAMRTTAVALFAVVGLIVWWSVATTYRYLLTIELLTPILVFGAACRLVPRSSLRAPTLTLVLLLNLVLTAKLPMSHRAEEVIERGDWFGVDVAWLSSDALVVAATLEPSAFIAPYLPASVSVVHVNGNHSRYIRGTLLEDRARSVIQEHTGPLYALVGRDAHESSLAAYGLAVRTPPACRAVGDSAATRALELCPLDRLPRRRAP